MNVLAVSWKKRHKYSSLSNSHFVFFSFFIIVDLVERIQFIFGNRSIEILRHIACFDMRINWFKNNIALIDLLCTNQNKLIETILPISYGKWTYLIARAWQLATELDRQIFNWMSRTPIDKNLSSNLLINVAMIIRKHFNKTKTKNDLNEMMLFLAITIAELTFFCMTNNRTINGCFFVVVIRLPIKLINVSKWRWLSNFFFLSESYLRIFRKNDSEKNQKSNE